MRDKLNNSPAAQIGVVLVLVVLGFVMFTQLGGGEEAETVEEPGATEATVSIAATTATGTATGASPGEAVEGAVESAMESTAASAPATTASVPVPPLPKPVQSAYDGGKTVVLLVVHDGGIDDRLVTASTKRLEAFPEAAVFIVPARQVARYGAITLGVEVQQVPALIVMQPKKLSHGAPRASVNYGFQTQQAVEQAMRDASYRGPEATYHPG
jgi:hypothetical protein